MEIGNLMAVLNYRRGIAIGLAQNEFRTSHPYQVGIDLCVV